MNIFITSLWHKHLTDHVLSKYKFKCILTVCDTQRGFGAGMDLG